MGDEDEQNHKGQHSAGIYAGIGVFRRSAGRVFWTRIAGVMANNRSAIGFDWWDRKFYFRSFKGGLEVSGRDKKREHLAIVCTDADRDADWISSDSDRIRHFLCGERYELLLERTFPTASDHICDPCNFRNGGDDCLQFEAGPCQSRSKLDRARMQYRGTGRIFYGIAFKHN